MNKLASLGGVAGAGVAGLAIAAVLAGPGEAADRAVSQAAAVTPMAHVSDVYAWMSSASNLSLAMDVSPQDDGSHSFDPSVLYVLHVTSKSGLGLGPTAIVGAQTEIICRFASSTSVQCWVIAAGSTKDYVSGDPSNPAGVASLLGKLKVFAGRRSDPSSFNLSGFNSAISTYTTLLGSNGSDMAGCPGISGTEAGSLRGLLATGSDSFAASNVMAIVVQIDKTLVNADKNTVVSVWGSTHVGQ